MSDRPQQPAPPASSINLNDIYYVVFRHKWMILAFAAAGFLAAVVLHFVVRAPYSSEAKLLVRYVLDTRSVAPSEKDSQVRSPDARGETIINSELEILTSLDLAGEVADLIGPEKILARLGGGTNRLNAAGVIANPKNLIAEVPKNSSIIRITFQHRDPAIVQPVLSHLIQSYVKKHLEIHRGIGVLDDFLSQQTDNLRSSLAATEAALWKVKTNAGIISVEDSKKAFNDQIMKIQEALLTAEAELAERQAAVKELEKFQPAGTNAAAEVGAPADIVNEYKSLCERLNAFRRSESTNSIKFSDENPILKSIRANIVDTEKKKSALEEKHPKLATLALPSPSFASSAIDSRNLSLDPMSEFARAKALEAKVKVLTAQLAKVRAEAAMVDQAGTEINKLQRQKELEEANYRYYTASREQARVDQALGPGRITDISVVQQPSSPSVALNKKKKMMLGAFGGLFAAGLALAFGFELFLDPRVKRASEIEAKLHIPLFLSVPMAVEVRSTSPRPSPQGGEGKGLIAKIRKWKGAPHPGPLPRAEREDEGGEPSSVRSAQSSDPSPLPSALSPYHAAIRDRLAMYFQARNMTHKPKLIGLTSCGRHSGVTTLAAGLAASLSEVGSGNVLLVDMGIQNGVAHPFHQGKPVCPLHDALGGESRSDALVQDNLYLATTNGHETGSQTLAIVPAKFSSLMPRLKESDYDYIIFDLPPVSSTSPSASLAGMLDLTFLVVEAEKSNRESVKHSLALLTAARANVAAILNKTRNYLPSWLHEEI